MINIRKILLLSALLISVSSITAPTYAVEDDEQGVSAPRTIYATVPQQLTLDMIPEIRKHKSFLTPEAKYVLQTPGELTMFENCIGRNAHPSFDTIQCFSMDRSELTYVIHGCLNASYKDNRGIFWEFSKLTFKEQDPAPAKPLAVTEEEGEGSVAASSTQASSSVNPSNNVSIESKEEVVEEPVSVSSIRPEDEVEEPVVANSMQTPMSVDQSHEVDSERAIKALIE